MKPVLFIIGFLIGLVAVTMTIPALVDGVYGNPDWPVFAGCAAVTGFCSITLILTFRCRVERLSLRQGFLLTNLAWLAICGFGALPLILAHPHLRVIDAVFESVSGLSTTGGTVIVGLDHLDHGILLWRALLNWQGGIGIVVMALIVLPFLRVGGMQLFRTESSDRSDKPFSSVKATAAAIGLIYVSLTGVSTLAFVLAGMPVFDSICHAMAAIATGGYSTKDASLGFFDSAAINWVATTSMMCGALPLTWYLRLYQRPGVFWTETQPLVFLGVLGLSIAMMTGWTWGRVYPDFFTALTQSAVNVTSIISDTGFVATDYNQWGTFAISAFFFFYFIGGCTGSTSGSIKIFRWQILAGSVAVQMSRMLAPNRVLVRTYDHRRVDDEVAQSVIGYFFAYVASFGVLSVAMGGLGNDFLTSLSGVATAMAGAGPGLGDIIGPAGSFAPLNDMSKALLCFAMLLGRLELFTLYIMLTFAFWRY